MASRVASDVIVVGGGVIGSSTAFFLRQLGLSVSLVERDLVGQHASGTNFGNIRRQGPPAVAVAAGQQSQCYLARSAPTARRGCGVFTVGTYTGLLQE